MHILYRVIGLILLMLLMVACGSAAPEELTEAPSDTVENPTNTITFTVTEEQLNADGNLALSFGETELVQNVGYDIQPGRLIVEGDLLCDDGTREYGLLAINLSLSDGAIVVRIFEETTGCLSFETDNVIAAQEALSSTLVEAVSAGVANGQALRFSGLIVADGSITVTVILAGQ